MLCCSLVGDGITIFAVLTFRWYFTNICTSREYILDDDDCPLNILMNHQVGKFYGEIFCDLCISRRAKERLLFTFVGDQVREVLDQGGGKRSRLKGRAEGGDIVWYLCWNIDSFLDPGCFSFTLIQSGRDFLFLWSSHLKEEKTELLDFSFLSLRFVSSCFAVFVCLEMIFEMFGVCLD